jgi:hypothetical protein
VTEEAFRRLYLDSEIGARVRKAVAVIDASGTHYWNLISPYTGGIYPPDASGDDDDGFGDDREPDDDDDGGGGDDDDAEADISKAGGHHELAGALVRHLSDALERRREAHGYTKADTGKESSMDPTTQLIKIMKDGGGPVALCKSIVASDRPPPCTEAELTAAIGKAAAASGEREDVAFSRLYQSEESVRRACQLAKSAEFSVFDIKPVVVAGPDAMHEAVDDTEQSAALRAYEEIVRIGREKFPFLSADQQFARVFEDKNYAALAAQAHRTPAPTTIYQPPAAQGTAYTKSDPAPNTDTAYAELMHKAEQYRSAHPDLSIAQAFEKIYTARDNIELAKRERVESAPR